MATQKEDKIVRGADLSIIGSQIKAKLAEKQNVLVSGTNIKTINNTSILGDGNINIADGQDGASAYELWIAAGNTGTVADFLESLKGDTGVVIDEQTFLGTIVNNLTSGGASKALSAEMGKTLDKRLRYDDESVVGAIGYYSTNASSLPTTRNSSTTVYSAKFSVLPGDTITITGVASSSNYYRLWATYASDGTRVGRFTETGTYRTSPYILVIDEGITDVVINLSDYDESTDSIIRGGRVVNFTELAEDISENASAINAEVAKQQYMQITLSHWGSSFTLGIGEYGYKSDTKIIRYNIGDGQGGNKVIDVPFYDGAIYRYNNNLYYWDVDSQNMARYGKALLDTIESDLSFVKDKVSLVGEKTVEMVIGSLLNTGTSQGTPPAALDTNRARMNAFAYPPFSVKAKDGYRIYGMHRYASDAVLDTTSSLASYGYSSYIKKEYTVAEDNGYKYRFVIAKEDATEDIDTNQLGNLIDFKSGLFMNEGSESSFAKYYINTEKTENYSSYASLIDAYDQLVDSYPLFIAKNRLGVTGQDVEIYEYVISKGNYNKAGRRGTRDSEIAKPIFGIMTGVHGYEKSSINATYYIVRDILSGNSALSTLLDNAEIHIIPCVCPWGFDNNSRTNYNGVNINRNFSAGWYEHDAGTNDYSGPSAASEAETQIAQAWIDSMHSLGAKLVIDWHNSGYEEEMSCFASCTNQLSGVDAVKKSYLYSVSAVSSILIRTNSVRKDAIWAYTCTSNGAGYGNKYMESVGQVGCYFETSYNVDEQATYSINTSSVNASIMGNALLGWSELYKLS